MGNLFSTVGTLGKKVTHASEVAGDFLTQASNFQQSRGENTNKGSQSQQQPVALPGHRVGIGPSGEVYQIPQQQNNSQPPFPPLPPLKKQPNEKPTPPPRPLSMSPEPKRLQNNQPKSGKYEYSSIFDTEEYVDGADENGCSPWLAIGIVIAVVILLIILVRFARSERLVSNSPQLLSHEDVELREYSYYVPKLKLPYMFF